MVASLEHALVLLIMPAGLVALGMLLVIAMILRTGRPRRALTPAVAGLLLYYAMSTWLVPGIALRVLQHDASMVEATRQTVGAIVVLAGEATYDERGRAELNGPSWRRLWRGLELQRSLGSSLPLVYAGGPLTDPSGQVALGIARQFGVAEDRFWIEPESRNTFESAVLVKRLLGERLRGDRAHHIALVTSAWHMPRARMAFERRGMTVVAEPADYRTARRLWSLEGWLPTAEALDASALIAHETIGIVAYRLNLRGR